MIHPLRKFSVTYNGKVFKIVYIVESPGGTITLTGMNEQGELKHNIPIAEVNEVTLDD